MESGVDFSDGVKIWGDFSWANAIDAAASVSVALSVLTVGVLNMGLIFFWMRSIYCLVKGQLARALKNLLIAPGGMLALYLCFQLGPYALLGLWSGVAIAGVGYAVARRLTLWRLARRFPEAVAAAGYESSFRKIFFQPGRRVRWMFKELGAPTAEMLKELERRAVRAPAALDVAKLKSSM